MVLGLPLGILFQQNNTQELHTPSDFPQSHIRGYAMDPGSETSLDAPRKTNNPLKPSGCLSNATCTKCKAGAYFQNPPMTRLPGPWDLHETTIRLAPPLQSVSDVVSGCSMHSMLPVALTPEITDATHFDGVRGSPWTSFSVPLARSGGRD